MSASALLCWADELLVAGVETLRAWPKNSKPRAVTLGSIILFENHGASYSAALSAENIASSRPAQGMPASLACPAERVARNLGPEGTRGANITKTCGNRAPNPPRISTSVLLHLNLLRINTCRKSVRVSFCLSRSILPARIFVFVAPRLLDHAPNRHRTRSYEFAGANSLKMNTSKKSGRGGTGILPVRISFHSQASIIPG